MLSPVLSAFWSQDGSPGARLGPAIVKLLLLDNEHWENISENLQDKIMKAPVTTEIMETIKNRNLFEVNWHLDLKHLFSASITLCWNIQKFTFFVFSPKTMHTV